MSWRHTKGTHLVQHDRVPALSELPRGLAACEAATRDMNRLLLAPFSAQQTRHAGMIARRRGVGTATAAPSDALRRAL